MLKTSGKYVVYASVYNIPPPEAMIMCDRIVVMDSKERLVYDQVGGNIDWYEGRFSKKMARESVASHLNFEWKEDGVFSEKEVRLVRSEEMQRIVGAAKRGGFRFYVLAQNIPEERVLKVMAIYEQLGKSIPWPKRESPVLVRTQGEKDDAGVKAVLARYLGEQYDYQVETDEIELASVSQLKKLRDDAKAEGYGL